MPEEQKQMDATALAAIETLRRLGYSAEDAAAAMLAFHVKIAPLLPLDDDDLPSESKEE